MQIKSKMLLAGKKQIPFWDLFVLCIILVISMIISALMGVLYFDKPTVENYLLRGKNYWVTFFNQQFQNESYLIKENQLDTLFLDIPFGSYQKILDKRTQSYKTGILLSNDLDFVPAHANLNQQNQIKVDLRLKGDWIDHLVNTKWSYRIHAKGEGQILGMTKFSIQAPEARNFLYEWAYHQHLMLEDVLTTRYGFINVVENGQQMGIYAYEESFNVELLESQQERQGIILRFDEEALWINRANFMEESMEIYNSARQDGLFMVTNNEQAELTVFQSNTVSENPTLNAEAETAIALLQGYINGDLSADKVFDLKKFGRLLAITDLWGANHAAYWHNLRYYYNPITSLIEPIGYDGDSGKYLSNHLANVFGNETFFDNPQLRRAYAAELERITQPGYTEKIKRQLQNGMTRYIPALREEYGEEMISIPWNFLEQRRVLLHDQINPAFPVIGRFSLDGGIGDSVLRIKIKNLMILPVKLIGVEIQIGDEVIFYDAREYSNSGEVLSDLEYPEIMYVNGQKGIDSPKLNLSIPISQDIADSLSQDENATITAHVQISGSSRVYEIPILVGESGVSLEQRPALLFSDAEIELGKHAFINKIDEDTLFILPGDWQVKDDLIIPVQYKIIVPPGVTLRFEENAIFLIGNQIHANGTESQPIRFLPIRENWGGLVVLSAVEPSSLENVLIERTSGIQRDGWVLTGGVTFYESPVTLFQTQFSNHQGEDALNLIHSDYVMSYVTFTNTEADALDTDFSDGSIQNCSFSSIGGDAVDVSGSKVTINDSFMTLITDKGVSAGEKSFITITNLKIVDANIGIASKDLSTVTIDRINLDSIHYAAFSAYIKKSVYGPASIFATNVITLDIADLALVQTGSTVTLDKVVMQTQDLDVSVLYELGVLGN
ncbi:MAG TPA: hypothetical protein DCG34_06075 [Clostridiales bacterium]|nr:hypothetical protein [Clostridiales bacterium]